jgi:undecaprenyl-diphosphatase
MSGIQDVLDRWFVGGVAWPPGRVLQRSTSRDDARPPVVERLVATGPAVLFTAALVALAILLLSRLLPFTDATENMDRRIIAFLNAFAGRSSAFDAAMASLSGNNLLQGGVAMALVWWTWFASSGRTAKDEQRREKLLVSVIALFVAVIAALVLRDALPFRPRPFAEPARLFVVPGGFTPTYISSSFPSGHAVVFFALAAALLSISRPIGSIALVHAVLVDSLPRLYLGLHYPSDVLAGALLAVVIVPPVTLFLRRLSAVRALRSWSERHPAAFYSLAFLVSLEIATEFGSTRTLLGLIAHRLV